MQLVKVVFHKKKCHSSSHFQGEALCWLSLSQWEVSQLKELLSGDAQFSWCQNMPFEEYQLFYHINSQM